MAKGQFGKMLNCPFKGVCHEKEVFKWMLQKATFLSEQQRLPLLYLLSSLWKVESRMCWQEVAAITLSRSFFLFSSTKELGDLVNYLKYSRYARLQIFQFRVYFPENMLCMHCHARFSPIVPFKGNHGNNCGYRGCNSQNRKARLWSDFTHRSVWKHLTSRRHARMAVARRIVHAMQPRPDGQLWNI